MLCGPRHLFITSLGLHFLPSGLNCISGNLHTPLLWKLFCSCQATLWSAEFAERDCCWILFHLFNRFVGLIRHVIVLMDSSRDTSAMCEHWIRVSFLLHPIGCGMWISEPAWEVSPPYFAQKRVLFSFRRLRFRPVFIGFCAGRLLQSTFVV